MLCIFLSLVKVELLVQQRIPVLLVLVFGGLAHHLALVTHHLIFECRVVTRDFSILLFFLLLDLLFYVFLRA